MKNWPSNKLISKWGIELSRELSKYETQMTKTSFLAIRERKTTMRFCLTQVRMSKINKNK